MKKILVPTDFSWNSKAGIRFAIQWARQQNIELVFTHVFNLMQPTNWSDQTFQNFLVGEKKIHELRLERFVKDIYRSMNVNPGKHSLLVIPGDSADLSIMNYCRVHKDIDAICISTRGAGGFKKIYGTNTGNLVTKSSVPVIAVPKAYKANRIGKVLYATDLRQFRSELKKVLAFTKPLDAKLEILHLSWLNDILPDEKLIEEMMKEQFHYKLKVRFARLDFGKTWIRNMQEQIHAYKPSVVVMFTDQSKTIFQKLFTPSKSEQLSFQLRVPMLVFRKTLNVKNKTISTGRSLAAVD